MNQIFESKNISFVEVTELLTDDYLVMVNDYENVNRFIGKRKELFTREQEVEWVRKKRAEGAVVFSMIEKGSGAFIGNIELMDESDSTKELGVAITADIQNKGYGTEAVLALVKYGFNQLGLKRICLRTNSDNARAIHVYKKCGFREYDRTEDHVFMQMTDEKYR